MHILGTYSFPSIVGVIIGITKSNNYFVAIKNTWCKGQCCGTMWSATTCDMSISSQSANSSAAYSTSSSAPWKCSWTGSTRTKLGPRDMCQKPSHLMSQPLDKRVLSLSPSVFLSHCSVFKQTNIQTFLKSYDVETSRNLMQVLVRMGEANFSELTANTIQ